MFGMEDSVLARMEASLAVMSDMKSHNMQQHHNQAFKTSDIYAHDMSYMNGPPKPHFSVAGRHRCPDVATISASYRW